MKHLFSLIFVLVAATYSNFGTAQMVTPTNASSPSACDGSAFFTIYNAYGPPFWSWHWEQDSIQIAGADSVLLNLCPGNYSLVLDSMGIPNYSEPFVIGDPCSNFTNYNSFSNCTAGNCDGSISFTPVGGSPPYTYMWSNGTTVQSISTLCPGTYSIVCTDSYGCSLTESFNIVEQASQPLQASLATVDDSSSNCTGNVTIYPTGGTAPYSILWSTNETTDYLDSLCAGLYSVSVWDANMDSISINFIIIDSSSTYDYNPYPNATITDTLYGDLVANCMIDYNAIDSAGLYQAVYDSINQNLFVTWAIYSPTDTIYISDTLGLTGNPGYYALNISVFCPNKSGNDFFKIESVIYFNGTDVWTSTLATNEHLLDRISVYPNPFSNSISIDNKDGSIRSMKLIDLNGRILCEMNQVNSGLVEMNRLEAISSGTYLLILSGENSSKTYKVIK
jgi:hypothetical protein